ncbi:mechanosensitive ion channel family protein [Neptunicella marina]|uniref:Mechanosensing system component YbdG n=1 Tax=Neptunicella marina TaxID=2125989 RepID=A0A8J6ISW3_9ALTE|nr:mechanosensitive ion channel domain-containing protein [Neptunicella marina]MBC3766825.1 mechanosensitive ion channel [Neptunicella marina]
MQPIRELSQGIVQLLSYLGFSTESGSAHYLSAAVICLLVIAWLGFYLTSFFLRHVISHWVLRTRNHWDDELHKHGFFRRFSHIIPAIIVYLCAPLVIAEKHVLLGVLSKVSLIYFLLAVILAVNAVLDTISDVYNASYLARKAPITGFIQVVKLLLAIIALVLIIANVLDKSPIILLSGLGAVTAVLLLVFRDAILGFVAGIQIAANRMVTNGDWIEMSKYGADGNVLEVGLTTVKVQNWDNTITTIPTYALISESFRNWRGMQESPGRRIKRSIYIDIHSIRFCDAKSLERFKQVRYIRQYIQDKLEQVSSYNKDNDITEEDLLNSRRLTNIGTFRAYMVHYLKQHPEINQNMTLMVRQLAPTELGVPLEIYCFSANKNWVEYEGIQSDLFDHFLAILPIFELRAYQRVGDYRPPVLSSEKPKDDE